MLIIPHSRKSPQDPCYYCGGAGWYGRTMADGDYQDAICSQCDGTGLGLGGRIMKGHTTVPEYNQQWLKEA